MKHRRQNFQRGIALLIVIFALVLVSAIGLAMMFSSNSETAVGSGYKYDQVAYNAARSGVEEMRDRMRYTVAQNANGLNDLLAGLTPIGQNNSVIYITNLSGAETAAGEYPWKAYLQNGPLKAPNPYFDTELCHEIQLNSAIPNSVGMSPSTPCDDDRKNGFANPQLPSGNNWYIPKTAQNLPNGVTLSYKWARLNLKLGESSNPWCVQGYGVCSHPTTPGGPAQDQVCYIDGNEFVLSDLRNPIDVPDRVEGVSLPS